jgi:hypothetical protein
MAVYMSASFEAAKGEWEWEEKEGAGRTTSLAALIRSLVADVGEDHEVKASDMLCYAFVALYAANHSS